MPGLFQLLSLGTNAMQNQQIILQTVGNNISNESTPGYTRQRADLTTQISSRFGNIILGNGAFVKQVGRIQDVFLQQQLVDESAALKSFEVRSQFLTQVEDVLNEPGEDGIAGALAQFFSGLQDLATTPEDNGVRIQLRDSAITLADAIRHAYQNIDEIRTSVNDRIQDAVEEANKLAIEISDLNRQIVGQGQGIAQDNNLLDRRDQAVRDLGDLIGGEITTNENGTVNVFLDGYAVVQEFSFHLLETTPDPGLDPFRADLVSVRGANGGPVLDVRSGQIGGFLDFRDNVLTNSVLADLNTLAQSLVEQVNRVQLQGVGPQLFATETSTYGVDDSTATLDSVTGLPFPVQAGAFFITVYDSGGAFIEQREITVDPTVDSLDDIVARINTEFPSANVVASVTGNGQLNVTAAPGNTFSFISNDTAAPDTSDLLLALGVNQFLTFNEGFAAAETINVDQELQDNVGLISSGRTTSPGDNQNAIDFARLRDVLVPGTVPAQTFEELYQSIVVEVGVTSADLQARTRSQTSFVVSVENRIASVSGVNIDEEAINLIQSQTAFQAAARFVNTVSNVLEILTNEVG